MQKEKKPIGYRFAKRLMPKGTDEVALLEAAGNVERFIAVLYQICDRLVRENEQGKKIGK